jgi:hypothetical protein
MTITDGWMDAVKCNKFCPFCDILTPRQYSGQREGGLAEMAHQYKIKRNKDCTPIPC